MQGHWQGHTAVVRALAFSPDGRTLASGSGDHTIVLWKTPQRPAGPAAKEPAEKQWATWWDDLGNKDAAAAYRALAAMVAHPGPAVKWMEARLTPAAPIDGDRIPRLVKDLDSPEFATRQDAFNVLVKLDTAEPAVRKAIALNPPLETRLRLLVVLEKLEQMPLTPDQLRCHRAIIALQWLDTSEARQLLERLAGGAPDTRQTTEASAALRHNSGRTP